MKDETIAKRFSDTIDKVAERFPHQPVWQQIKTKFETEFVNDVRSNDQTDGVQKSEISQSDVCFCCGQRKIEAGNQLCENCLRLYTPRSSRVVNGHCDCGHQPKGANVYIYGPYGKDVSLCGIECVRDHYRDLFGVFFRRLS
jgi:hypothetical protein